MYKNKISLKELMDMDNPEFYALYHSAWKMSIQKAKEAEAMQKEQEEMEKQAKRGNSGKNNAPLSSRQRMAGALGGLSSNDLQELMEEME